MEKTATGSILSYCDYTNTIRQFPENYLIAHWDSVKAHWSFDPDLACDKELAMSVSSELMNYDSKYCQEGLNLLAKLTPKIA